MKALILWFEEEFQLEPAAAEEGFDFATLVTTERDVFLVDAATIPHVRISIIVVRIAVARLESISLTPIFAKIAVNDANRADNRAYIFHILIQMYYPLPNPREIEVWALGFYL